MRLQVGQLRRRLRPVPHCTRWLSVAARHHYCGRNAAQQTDHTIPGDRPMPIATRCSARCRRGQLPDGAGQVWVGDVGQHGPAGIGCLAPRDVRAGSNRGNRLPGGVIQAPVSAAPAASSRTCRTGAGWLAPAPLCKRHALPDRPGYLLRLRAERAPVYAARHSSASSCPGNSTSV